MTYDDLVTNSPAVQEAVQYLLSHGDAQIMDKLLRAVFQAGRTAASTEAAARAFERLTP